jgi:hypothetical protein
VDYGLKDFNICILDMVNSDDISVINALEDSWILKYNSLHPLGFNLRLNAEIVPDCKESLQSNDDFIDVSNLQISAKYVFSANDKHVFTVGECTLARDFQTLTNVIAQYNSKNLINKKKEGFRYIQISIFSATEYVRDEVYELNLRYNPKSDTLHQNNL